MKVVLIRPPKFMIEGSQPIPIIPPLGIALIAGSLKAAGHQVNVIDAIAEAPNQFNKNEPIPVYSNRVKKGYRLISMGLSFEEIASRIPLDVDVIGLSCMFSINWPLDRALIKYLAGKFPLAKMIAGGESITGMAETCLQQAPQLIACVMGEGEETSIELLSAFEKNLPLSNVPGIMCRLPDGTIYKTKPRQRIRKLDEVPFPDWSTMPIYNYQRHAVYPGETPRITLGIMATRGCPYECTFCTSPDMWGTRYFMRSPDNVIAEIEYMKNIYGATNFEFFDLTAIIQKRWIIEFAQKLVEKKLNITWKIPAGTRSEAIDEEVAYWLKKSGCFFITYAPESGSQRLLNIIKKKVSLDNILQSIKYSKKQGMIVYINMIMGLPDETHLDVWKTFLFLFKCKLNGVDEMPLAVFRPYPGSSLFDRLLKEGKIESSSDDYVIDSLFIIETITEHQYYNDNISAFWYKIYMWLAYFFFYGLDYIKNPTSILRTIRNISEKNYQNELERKLAYRYQSP
ncbi:MAG: B12-binding domain-containing radical SAM protein [Chitinophagales bacterium]|nr:B12-binding domain-containing radical SAM protein [Chitinophagales bacterium]MDW8417802.1 radical SAM protein [Chitinophagales bacterium]